MRERVLSVFSPLKIRNRSGSLDFPADESSHTHRHTKTHTQTGLQIHTSSTCSETHSSVGKSHDP